MGPVYSSQAKTLIPGPKIKAQDLRTDTLRPKFKTKIQGPKFVGSKIRGDNYFAVNDFGADVWVLANPHLSNSRGFDLTFGKIG